MLSAFLVSFAHVHDTLLCSCRVVFQVASSDPRRAPACMHPERAQPKLMDPIECTWVNAGSYCECAKHTRQRQQAAKAAAPAFMARMWPGGAGTASSSSTALATASSDAQSADAPAAPTAAMPDDAPPTSCEPCQPEGAGAMAPMVAAVDLSPAGTPSRRSSSRAGAGGLYAMRAVESAAASATRAEAREAREIASASKAEAHKAAQEQAEEAKEAELRQLRFRISELEAAAAERSKADAKAAAKAEAERTKAAAAAALARRVEEHLTSKIAKRVADAADHNTSFNVSTPLVAAAIHATFRHARTCAVARRDGQLPQDTSASVLFDPLASGKPDLNTCFAAGCQLNVFDPRKSGMLPSLTCHCGLPLQVAKHRPDPDGVVRERYSATTNGSLGLTKDVAFGAPAVTTSPELICSRGHTAAMHAPAIVAQLPEDTYHCDAAYILGMQMHISRDVSNVAESLYEESPTTLAGITSAMDENLAIRFEIASEQYHLARRDYLNSLAPLGPLAVAAAAATLPCVNETMRKELYGLGPSEGVLAERVEAKLVSETGVRVDELRSLTIEGPLLHVCAADDADRAVRNACISKFRVCATHAL